MLEAREIELPAVLEKGLALLTVLNIIKRSYESK